MERRGKKRVSLERGRTSVKGETRYVRHSFTCRAGRWRIATFAEIFKPVASRKRGAFQEVAGARPVLASLKIHGRYATGRKQIWAYLVNVRRPKIRRWRHKGAARIRMGRPKRSRKTSRSREYLKNSLVKILQDISERCLNRFCWK